MELITLENVLFGLCAALSYGIADYCGGIVSRRNATFTVIVLLQLTGTLFFVAIALLTRDPLPPQNDFLVSIVAGVLSFLGINLFLQSLKVAKMSVVSPVTALVVACLPVGWALFTQGAPSVLTLVGFALALGAVWLISSGGSLAGFDVRIIWMPLLAGFLIGIVFIIVAEATDVSRFWSLATMRATMWLINLGVVRWRKVPLWLPVGDRPLIIVAGLTNAGGSAFFVLATQAGRLDVASVLTNLSPGVTVFLAALLLKERLNRWQLAGLGLAAGAIVLISL